MLHALCHNNESKSRKNRSYWICLGYLNLHIPEIIFVISGRVSPMQGNTAIIENEMWSMSL